MEPVTGLTERETGEGAGWWGWIGRKTHGAFDAAAYCCHYPALILHRQDGTSSPPPHNLISLLGRKQGRNPPPRRTSLLWFHAFLDVSLSEATCCSPFDLSENSLRETIVWPPPTPHPPLPSSPPGGWGGGMQRFHPQKIPACSMGSELPPSLATQYGSCLFARSGLPGPDSWELPPRCPSRGPFTFY